MPVETTSTAQRTCTASMHRGIIKYYKDICYTNYPYNYAYPTTMGVTVAFPNF